MQGHTIILHGKSQREHAKRVIDQAPAGAIVNVKKAKRTNDQNAKMWAMLSDISIAKPEGREYTPDMWKAVFMNACGYQVQFLQGLDGEPFPTGFRTSKLTVAQMGDLITFIYQYGDDHGVQWSEPPAKDLAA